MKMLRDAAVMFVVAAASATEALAAPITFNFTFTGGAAKAVGSITFESTLISNPGTNDIPLPNPAVLALNVTVSGASAGNGTFGIGSFSEVRFETGGATLNFSQQLVGQATPGGAWGTPTSCCGDFNLFATGPPAPNGEFFFTLVANNGDAEPMTLSSMTQGSGLVRAPVPALDDAMLLLLALLVAGLGVAIVRRQASAGSKAA
jgi:hypothetical protein